MLNTKLMLDTMAHIEEHPEQWEQDIWGQSGSACGTTACFAGWATIIENPKNLPPEQRFIDWYVNGRWINQHAREILGLTPAQAELLFDQHRTMGELKAAVAVLVATGGAVADQDLERVIHETLD